MGLAVPGCERFRGMPIRSVPLVIGLLIMLNVAAEEGDSIVSGGNTEERELLIEESDHRETGGQPFQIHDFLIHLCLF